MTNTKQPTSNVIPLWPNGAPGSEDWTWHEQDTLNPAELHIYSKGGHGFGLRPHGQPADTWTDRFGDWLTAQGFNQHEGEQDEDQANSYRESAFP
jgi:hypothetical protein